ncbi:MAG: hypothetical protein ISS93_01445 [Candidatus Aenigmarchaeota archaeon]|nr:hypothetical protein [Candidatus Aenigmarchaeota archaeon]
MGRNTKALVLVILLLLAALVWAPWLDEHEIHDQILQEKAKTDGTIDSDGELICDYSVMWFPFGRWVASCEGGYFVTFYGNVMP